MTKDQTDFFQLENIFLYFSNTSSFCTLMKIATQYFVEHTYLYFGKKYINIYIEMVLKHQFFPFFLNKIEVYSLQYFLLNAMWKNSIA